MREKIEHLLKISSDQEMTFGQSLLHRLVRWAYMVGQGFVSDQCLLWASALAFVTALSLVPLLAVAFSISKGFGIQNTEFIRELLLQLAAGSTETVDTIIGYINNTNVRTLGTVGVGFLFVTVISLVNNIEKSFNTIWGVKANRSLWRKFSDYLTVIMVCPLLIVIAISATASLENSAFMQNLLAVSALNTLYIGLFKVLPYCSSWMALLFVYSFIPNTRVKVGAALTGAILSGTLWQGVQWAYINYQASFKNYNAIYGSFAQVPLLLIWLFISWVIVLLGAQISFAIQNSATYYREGRLGQYSHDDRQRLAALALALITRTFMHSVPSPTNEEMAHRLDAPVKLVNDVMHMLASAGLVVKIDTPEAVAYSLARSPDEVRLLDVMHALSRYKEGTGPEALTGRLDFLEPVFAQFATSLKQSDQNLTLAELAKVCDGQPMCSFKDEQSA